MFWLLCAALTTCQDSITLVHWETLAAKGRESPSLKMHLVPDTLQVEPDYRGRGQGSRTRSPLHTSIPPWTAGGGRATCYGSWHLGNCVMKPFALSSHGELFLMGFSKPRPLSKHTSLIGQRSLCIIFLSALLWVLSLFLLS